MRTYARINAGAVAELLSTDQDITRLFHPSLHWVDVTGRGVEVGWLMTANGFTAPPPPPASPPVPPTIAQLQAQLTELTARVAKLAPPATPATPAPHA
jgi:hypothetical protein